MASRSKKQLSERLQRILDQGTGRSSAIQAVSIGSIVCAVALALVLGTAPLPAETTAQKTNPESKPGKTAVSASENANSADTPPFTYADLEKAVERSETGHFKLNMVELHDSSRDPEVRKVLDEQPVETIGQMTGDQAAGNRVRISRQFIQCCADHAKRISILAEFDERPQFEELSWARVAGSLTFEANGESEVPILRVAVMEQIKAPGKQMLGTPANENCQARNFRMDYIRIADMSPIFLDIAKRKNKWAFIETDEAKNTATITSNADVIASITKLVKDLDRPPPQIYIENGRSTVITPGD